jgi:hypothetical protein
VSNFLIRVAERDVNPVHVGALDEIQVLIHQPHLRLRRRVVSPRLSQGRRAPISVGERADGFVLFSAAKNKGRFLTPLFDNLDKRWQIPAGEGISSRARDCGTQTGTVRSLLFSRRTLSFGRCFIIPAEVAPLAEHWDDDDDIVDQYSRTLSDRE